MCKRECSGLATVRFLNNNSFSSWKEFSFNNFSEWLETNFLIASLLFNFKEDQRFFLLQLRRRQRFTSCRDLNRTNRRFFYCRELFSNANKKSSQAFVIESLRPTWFDFLKFHRSRSSQESINLCWVHGLICLQRPKTSRYPEFELQGRVKKVYAEK